LERGVERHEHGRERYAGLEEPARQSEVARGQRVVLAAPRAERRLDRLDEPLELGVAIALAQTATTSNCSWCRSGSASTVSSPPVSADRARSTFASSPSSARATSGLTRSTSFWPPMSGASLRTSS